MSRMNRTRKSLGAASANEEVCGLCQKPAADDDKKLVDDWVQCDDCKLWMHYACAGVDDAVSELLRWSCTECDKAKQKSTKTAKGDAQKEAIQRLQEQLFRMQEKYAQTQEKYVQMREVVKKAQTKMEMKDKALAEKDSELLMAVAAKEAELEKLQSEKDLERAQLLADLEIARSRPPVSTLGHSTPTITKKAEAPANVEFPASDDEEDDEEFNALINWGSRIIPTDRKVPPMEVKNPPKSESLIRKGASSSSLVRSLAEESPVDQLAIVLKQQRYEKLPKFSGDCED